ncbi:MAG: HD domain-containing protein [Candidatus Pacearchaeota archaeon]|jgi:HD superfamily phosphodiesterase
MSKKNYVSLIEKIVKSRCKKQKELLNYHIIPAVEYAYQLVDIVESDKEIAILGTWLHDISKISWYSKPKRDRNNHHINGSKESGRILSKLGYDPLRTKLVQECVLRHSTDKRYHPKTIEEKIVVSADSLSHLYNVPRLCKQAYSNNTSSIKDDTEWLINKCENLIAKMEIPEARNMAIKRYEQIKQLFS